MYQFKIVHHILPTNATLHRFGFKEHDRCHYCAEKQTFTHLFVTCLNAQMLWSRFTEKRIMIQSRYLKRKYHVELQKPCLRPVYNY